MISEILALLESRFAVYLIPISTILVWGVLAWQKENTRHRERLAMIERGMRPDPDNDEKDD